ncbi:MAG: YeeE/YedE thiosulfate transporter family protein [Ignavibacteria bacterium]|nr:YeeE/YedE thiosulfate transporter family protein [Ignavibacteria bacterium]MDP3832052.1 YeeE/YedE thiosulfate transporter family protein [Ignavibacteriaceae bacterium]
MALINIVFGLVVGFIFGFILSKTGITKYNRVMGMLLLKDFKILKFMLTAVTFSMILFYLLGDFGLLKVVSKNLDWGKLVGGLIFGTGMGLLGYCPGTMAARIGEGKKEAIFALFGMSLGILIYALSIKYVKTAFLSSEISGDIFSLFGLNKWLIIIPAALIFVGIIYFVNKKFSDNEKIF